MNGSSTRLRRGGRYTYTPLTTSSTCLVPHALRAAGVTRLYCSLTESDVKKRVEKITELFFDARELLEDAVSTLHL